MTGELPHVGPLGEGSRLSAINCPACGESMQIAKPMSVGALLKGTPTPGAWCICNECGAFLRFTDSLTLRVVKDDAEEYTTLPRDARVRMQHLRSRFVEEAWKKQRVFNVYQVFVGGQFELMTPEPVNAADALVKFAELTGTVGARIGSTCRVFIMDANEKIVFEWRYGEGVQFPEGAAFQRRE